MNPFLCISVTIFFNLLVFEMFNIGRISDITEKSLVKTFNLECISTEHIYYI